MYRFLVYLFWPNPANALYTSPKALMLLILCVCLVLTSIVLHFLRRREEHGALRKFLRSWSTACFWFGITGLVLVVARAEQIQYLSMRFLWVVWLTIAIITIWIQSRLFHAKYFAILPEVRKDDPRERYLPRKK